MTNQMGRRRVLSVAGGTVVALAGCVEFGSDGDVSGTETGPTETTTTGRLDDADEWTGSSTTPPSTDPEATRTTFDAPGTTTGATEDDGELDLREANVVEVAFDRQDGRIRFDVTLYHDDDGEAEYANWWQVETLDGKRLGRRELLHAHSTAPFTRSETVDVPEGVTCVVVRGHDQTHGYGGQAAIVNLESGATRLVRQGAERRSFDPSACP